MVKNLPITQDTRVQSLGQEDPLEKGTATYTSILYFFQWNAMDLFHVFKAIYNMDIILPGESHAQRNLAGYSPWICRVRHD